MPASYPSSIYTPRAKANRAGYPFKVADTVTIFAEDFNDPNAEIAAVEGELGTNPKGSSASVKARLDSMQSDINSRQYALGYTPEDVSNKKTGLSENSDAYYPTQKAVKTAVDAKQNSLGYTPENVSNKSTDINLGSSDTLYPSQKAVKDYVDNHSAALPAVCENDMQPSDDVIISANHCAMMLEYLALASGKMLEVGSGGILAIY